MAVEKIAAAGKRFGARYGRSLRYKFSKIEAEQKKQHKCPYCHEPRVGRLAVGIWQCSKCRSKFTGRAYTIPKKVIIKEEAPQEKIVAGTEEKEEKKEAKEKPQKYKEKKAEEPKEQ